MVRIKDLSKFYGDLLVPNCFLILAPPDGSDVNLVLAALEGMGFEYTVRPWVNDEDPCPVCTLVRMTNDDGGAWLRSIVMEQEQT